MLAVIEESRKNVPIYTYLLITLSLSLSLTHTHTHTHIQTFNEADQRLWQSMESNWEEEKEKILNSLLGSNQDIIELPTHSEVSML